MDRNKLFSLTLAIGIFLSQLLSSISQDVKKIDDPIILEPEKCGPSGADAEGNYILGHRAHIILRHVNFAVTEENLATVVPGNIIIASPDMVLKGLPQSVPLKLQPNLLYSSLPCLPGKPNKVEPTLANVQQILDNSIRDHFNKCRRFSVPGELEIKSGQFFSKAQIKAVFGVGSEVPEVLLRNFDENAAKRQTKSIQIEYYRKVFHRIHSTATKEFETYFNVSEDEVYQFLNQTPYSPALIRAVSYGRQFYLVTETDVASGNKTSKVYGRFYDHELSAINEARTQGKLRSLITKMLRFSKNNPGQPLSYQADYIESRHEVSTSIKGEYVVTEVKKPTLIQIVNDRWKDTTWEIKYDIIDVDENCVPYKTVPELEQIHALPASIADAPVKKTITLDGNCENIRISVADDSKRTIFDIAIDSSKRHSINYHKGIKSEDY